MFNMATLPIMWNKLGSDSEINNSEIGTNGNIIGSGYSYSPGKFGNGYYSTSVYNTRPEFGLLSDILDRDKPFTVEYWWTPDYDASSSTARVASLNTFSKNVVPDPLCASMQYRWHSYQRFELYFMTTRATNRYYYFANSTLGFNFSAGVPLHIAVRVHVAGGIAELILNGKTYQETSYYGGPLLPGDEILGDPTPVRFGYQWSSSHALYGVADNFKIYPFLKYDFTDRFIENVGRPQLRS
jgi:hypothetical protein